MKFAGQINSSSLRSFIVALFFSLAFANLALAGGETVRGKITEIGDSFIMIEQTKVLITSTTLLYDMNYKQVEFSYFKTGMLVEALVIKDGDNLAAKKIIEVKPNSDLYKMTGIIGAVGDLHFVMGNYKMLFNADTKFYTIEGQLADKSILKAGLSAEVQYKKTNEGTVAVIVKIIKGDEGQEFSVKGTITEVRKDGITLDKTAYPVGHDTKIYDINGNLIGLDGLQAGMYVELKGKKANGAIFTIQIKVIKKTDSQYFEFKGEIVKILDGIIVVGDKHFKVTPDTKVYLPDGTVADLSHLKVGMQVYIYAQNLNNELVALKIKIQQGTDNNKYMELKGFIEELGNLEIKINGKVYKFGQYVKVLRADGGEGNMELLKIRMNVVVKVQLVNNEWVVIQIRIVDLLDGDYFMAKGIITHRTGHSIVVMGKEFGLGNETEVVREDGTAGTLEDLKEGVYVEVKGKIVDGEIIALVVKILKHSTGNNDGLRFEAKGIIKEIAGHTIILSEKKFDFNGETEILFDNGQKADASSLKAGLTIEVIGIKDQNGNLVATRIIIKTNGDKGIVTIKDYITSLTNTTVTCHEKTFEINTDTKIYDANGNLIEISGLKVGDLVYINGVVKDNKLVALYIKLLPATNDHNYIVVRGKIEEIGDHVFKVGGKVFQLNNDTKIYKLDGTAGTLADLILGQMVEVKGIYDNSKNLVALIIKLVKTDGNIGKTIEIKGIVKEVGDDYVIVGDRKIKVDNQTLYYLANGEAGDLSSVTAGLLVVIKATYTSNTELLALKVMIKDDEYDNTICLKGIITELGSDYMLVNKTRFLVNEKTLYYNEKGEQIQYSDLAVDMGVYVKAVFVNGGYLATTVKLLERDGVPGIIERSNITDVTPDVIYSNNEDYTVYELTKVQDLFGYPYEISYLKAGMVVDVTGDIIDGVRYAESITIIDDMTTVEEAASGINVLVSPNPAAESLNMSLNLVNESKVVIRLYNMNGSLNMTIFDGTAHAGANNFYVNTDSLSAGTYFVVVGINGNQLLSKVEIIK